MRIIPLAAVGLALAIGSMAALASAQPAGTVHHVGVLGPPAEAPTMVAFRQALKDRGYSEERNIRFTYHEYRGPRDTDRVAEYWRSVVNDLLRLKVDVIVTTGPYTTRAAKAATETVPIVFNAPYVVDTACGLESPETGR